MIQRLDAERLLTVSSSLAKLGRDQFLLAGGQRLHILEPAVDRRRVAVFGNQRVERLDQVPGGAVDIGHQARMDVLGRTPAPLLAARDQLRLDRRPWRRGRRHRAVARLAGRRNDDADRLSQRRLDLGVGEHLREVRRADFLLAFGHQHEVDRKLDPGGLECVERGEECRLRPLLVDRAAADDRLALARPVDDPAFERRRRPFGRVVMLDVVHEVDGERVLGPGIERREHAGYAVGLDDPGLLESGVERQLAHVFGALAVC